MTLFQISEPGERQSQGSCKGRVVGIDLGTTNSLVAQIKDGVPVVIPDAVGRPLLPSVVHYGEQGGVLVGKDAQRLAADYPTLTISSVKRFMGRGPEDPVMHALSPYELVAEGTTIRLRIAGRLVTPVEVSAEILRVLRERAERELGGELMGAVITVPAYFDDAQRQATKDAGRLAGLEVLRLLAEPTAAALAYGLDKGSQGKFAVFDLGGGTFDISILKLVDGVFEVMATGGDSALGGDDFDRAIAAAVLEELAGECEPFRNVCDADNKRRLVRGDGARGPWCLTGEHGLIRSDAECGLIRRALDAARAARERLTTDSATELILARADGSLFRKLITRAELEGWVRPIVMRASKPCLQALKDAGIRDPAKDLGGVILVGGATRTPVVRKFVEELFQMPPLVDIDPDQVVAFGAAVQADLLAGGSSKGDVLLLDVIPLSLGIETMGGVVEKIIPRNSTIPAGAVQTFTTFADNQTGFDIHVVQGERETVEHCRSLARFVLKGLPPAPAGMARVEITFLVDADGILHVSAKEETTGLKTSIDVKPSYGLSDEEVERMLLESYKHAEEDMNARLLLTERVEAERILAATRTAMFTDAQLLALEVRVAIEAAMADLEERKAQADHRSIHEAIEALDQASKPFAEVRLNRSVEVAMQGRRVEEVEQKL